MDEFTPRNYQVELMKTGLERNTIVFLPTGSGKTFIALMIMKRMSGSLMKQYSDGGKISVILVNTITLVEQHAQYITDHTTLSVGQYTGDMNLDFWPKDKWYDEFNKYQVFIMTCQILVNLVNSNYIDLNKVNLLIFDECHRGVNDQPMRQLMKNFGTLHDPPRVLGLTATLLNGNCKPYKVMEEVRALETTYHSKVATVDGLAVVVGYSTNPQEIFKICSERTYSSTENIVKNLLQKACSIIIATKVEETPLNLKGLKPLQPSEGYKKLANLITDVCIQFELTGTYGGVKAILAHMIQIERIKKHCQDLNFFNILNYTLTTLSFAKKVLQDSMKNSSEIRQITRFSSDKVLRLFEIFEEYKTKSKESLCCIIFTQRRFTAKVISHILDSLSKCDPDFSYIKPNFMVGYNNNPYNDTRENLYYIKKNKQVLKNFADKEINVLVASNVLEEGVDIPKCTLVIKFDKPVDYRSYIQSKGRARHKSSLYYMMVENNEAVKYRERYMEFQLVEQTLNDYLIGKNIERTEPSKKEIEDMYNEDELPPYYVDGPNSARVSMASAIPLLAQYCSSLPSDIYTTYTPEWYIKNKSTKIGTQYSVIILLPTICPIVDPIEGDYMRSPKVAKKAAALKSCIMLHKIGELDDHLLPRKNDIPEADTNFLFTHFPDIAEQTAGHLNNRRLHPKQISKYLQGQIKPNTTHYLHIIHLNPLFKKQSEINNATMYDSYTSPLCFGFITANPIPLLCEFPIYVSMGTINVNLQINQEVTLQENEIEDIKTFHYTVFSNVIETLQTFMMIDNSDEAETLLLVPVDKTTLSIDFDVIRNRLDIKEVEELTSDEKKNLEVTQETFLKKIVTPWYRRDSTTYIVMEVSLNKSALTPFPNEDYSTYEEYFRMKHNLRIINPMQPLLLVKGLTHSLIFTKPKGREAKRKREKHYEEMSEHLLPELVVKQEFPSSLWIQARFLPTILSKITYLLQLEELRCKIARETGMGKEIVNEQAPLQLDLYLLDYEAHLEEEVQEDAMNQSPPIEDITMDLSLTSLNYNKDYETKMLESQFPWKDLEEPKDLERDLNITIMDIEYYENFICQTVTREDRLLKNESPKKSNKSQLALTYHKDFVEKSINLLDTQLDGNGPGLCDLYRALTTAKANDIVNLERLETLGDSFLKMITSVYIAIRFPSYDEDRATKLKGRVISNKNLYYLAKEKNLTGVLKFNELCPRETWLPPAFGIPKEMLDRIEAKEISFTALFNLMIPREEQISGQISSDTLLEIAKEDTRPDPTDESSLSSMALFFKSQYVGDKHVADVVESLLGTYISSCGLKGGIKFIEWIGLIPKSEDLEKLLKEPPPSPILNKNISLDKIDFHLPNWSEVEELLGYQFNDRGYLLQALTHASYTPNRITLSYEKLEFLGDAILDFLITCYIYESCGYLNPGQLTDLRSSLVNNNTFASLAVRCGFHKFLLMINSKLQGYIDKFVEYLKSKNYEIDDEVLILLEEDELNLAEYVDVPKVLGDIFEALAGAVFLDSNRDLSTVWRVFYKIMWKEIDLFSSNVPKNVIRRLFEWPGAYPKFGSAMATSDKKTLVALHFLLNGREKVVYGCGTNKTMAKRAAAKLALRSLGK